ncbi:MAG TPA: hypothetical protein VIC07_02540 [Acidimicrobiia bacterium]|jgi:hypothetical protein
MELRDVLLTLHIAAAGTWLGANIVQAVAPSMAAKQGPEAAAGWYRVAGRLSGRLYMPVGIVVAATGIWMILISETFDFSSVFVGIGFVVVIIGALLGKFVFEPGSERAAAAIESGDQTAIRSAASRIATFGAIDTLLVLLAITVMVLKLGA